MSSIQNNEINIDNNIKNPNTFYSLCTFVIAIAMSIKQSAKCGSVLKAYAESPLQSQ